MTRDVLMFSGEEALIVALTSELIPAAIQASEVQTWSGKDGVMYVRPTRELGDADTHALRTAGVRFVQKKPARGQSVRTARVWPALIAPRRAGDPDVPHGQTVLFFMDADSADAGRAPRTLLDLAAELLRLACDRCAYQLLEHDGGTLALLRVHDPPYYTVAACADRDTAVRAFVPLRTGQTRTWIELGFVHPLAQMFEPPAGHIGLIAGTGEWLTLPDGPWQDMFRFVELALPHGARDYAPAPMPGPLTVPLRLTSATRTEPPSLWVLRDAQDGISGTTGAMDAATPVAHVEALVRMLPDSVIARLSFAVLDRGGAQIVVLRARLGRSGPPQLDVAGTALLPLAGIPNLYVPEGAMVEPPLRRDTLRELLAPDGDRLYWLAPTGDRGFVVESAPERAFLPLTDWVEYLVHRSADELAPWTRAVTFELEPFQSIGAEWAQEPPRDEAPRTSRAKRKHVPFEGSDSAIEIPLPAPARAGTEGGEGDEPAAESATLPLRRTSPAEDELAALERAFLDADTPADDPARTEMWVSMARLLGQLARHKDAALCYVRAVWELSRADCAEFLAEWAAAEVAALGAGASAELLWYPVTAQGADNPGADRVRAVAVQWIATGLTGSNLAPLPQRLQGALSSYGHALQVIQQWFARHDTALDVRTLWLLRWSLAAHVGGDPLGLARARDRVLQSLQSGLSLTRDVPAFLRFLGQQGGGDSAAVAQLTHSLEALVELFEQTRRQRSAVEAPTVLTRAYLFLVIAYGFARLGHLERATALRDQAARQLDAGDPVHGYLVRAYSARIEQALQGLPPETPLPAGVVGLLNALEDRDNKLERYKVDRLRQVSMILEPQERIVAWHGYLRRKAAASREEFAALRGLGAAELAAQVTKLMDVALSPDTAGDERARLFDGLMDVFPMLPDAQAVPALRRILGALDDIEPSLRVLLLEEALMLAGYFGREELAGEIAHTIVAVVAELPAAEAESLAPAFGACLRSLRRVGLRERAATLIDVLSSKVTGDSVQALEARLHLAAGLAHLGHFEQARPILAHARDVLDTADFRVVDQRLRLLSALAQAFAECPKDQAIQGLGSLTRELGKITDNYNTNSHFCLSIIWFMEALVLGYAKSDLALGELGRRWLDEDEHLVRRRIHRELGERS